MIEKYPDIYFEPFWLELNEQRIGGSGERFLFKTDLGECEFNFIKRPLEFLIDGKQYYDIVTPCGFSGPIVYKFIDENKKSIIEKFEKAFGAYCEKENIIAEYVQFNPWIGNAEEFKKYYKLKWHCYTWEIDLTKDYRMNSYNESTRNKVRKAKKLGVEVIIDERCTEKNLNEFYKMYQLMIEKNNVDSYYRYSYEYLKKNIQMY